MKQSVKELIVRAKALLDEAGVVAQSMNEKTEWDSTAEIVANVVSLYKFVSKVVVCIEEAAGILMIEVEEFKSISSEDKLDAAAAIVDQYLSLPFYLELIDGPAIKILISFVVTFLNDKFGDVWNITEVKKTME